MNDSSFLSGHLMEHDNSSLVELLPEFFHQWPKNLEWAREKDKKTNIDWPIKEGIIISEKDKNINKENGRASNGF